jgi:hypothetical protein
MRRPLLLKKKLSFQEDSPYASFFPEFVVVE